MGLGEDYHKGEVPFFSHGIGEGDKWPMEKFANDLGIFFALEYFGTTHPGRKEHTFTGHLLPSDDMSEYLH